jgi:hypothetical protein
MALSKTITICDGQVEILNAYLKITTLRIVTNGENNTCFVCVNAYKDKESADINKPPITSYSDSFVPIFGTGTPDIKEQGYIALKEKEFYKDAIDC